MPFQVQQAPGEPDARLPQPQYIFPCPWRESRRVIQTPVHYRRRTYAALKSARSTQLRRPGRRICTRARPVRPRRHRSPIPTAKPLHRLPYHNRRVLRPDRHRVRRQALHVDAERARPAASQHLEARLVAVRPVCFRIIPEPHTTVRYAVGDGEAVGCGRGFWHRRIYVRTAARRAPDRLRLGGGRREVGVWCEGECSVGVARGNGGGNGGGGEGGEPRYARDGGAVVQDGHRVDGVAELELV